MKPFHLNLGNRFAQPYESQYAMLRRCLIANPGIPLSIIEANLRNLVPGYSSTMDHLRSLQLSSGLVQTDNKLYEAYRRQCPVRAQHLYHTNIYDLPWISLCPIHHCAFTTICPTCEQPWPDKKALATRDCPNCGRLSFSQLIEFALPSMQNVDYRPIADIYEFINHDSDDDLRLVNYERNGNVNIFSEVWWNMLSIYSPLFPSCQAHRHPTFSTAKLKPLHIRLRPMHHKSTPMLPFDKQNSEPINPSPDTCCLDINKTTQRLLKPDFKVMQYIVSWISRQTPCRHQIHIADYRHLVTKDFFDRPDPCPYCLALSLWFFDTASKKYSQFYVDSINIYPFCWEAGFNNFYNISEPYLTHDFRDRFILNKNFTIWFYRRGLEISFVDILRFTFDLLRRIQGYRRNDQPSNFNSFYHYPRDFLDRQCSTSVIDSRFFFYYENEHPLESYVPPKFSKLDTQCRNYYRYLSECHDKVARFDYAIPTSEFTYDTFLSLHQEFRMLLKHLLLYRYSYGPGSIIRRYRLYDCIDSISHQC